MVTEPGVPQKKPLIYYYIVAMVVILLLNIFVFPAVLERSVVEVSYDKFISMVDDGAVTAVARDDQQITFLANDENGKERVYKTGDWAYEDLTDRLLSAGVKFEKEIPTKTSPLLSLLVSWMLPIFFFLFSATCFPKSWPGWAATR